jgi:CDP-diacylglycerol--glycerol-3-phosphate 3-phosphatidyltransferase
MDSDTRSDPNSGAAGELRSSTRLDETEGPGRGGGSEAGRASNGEGAAADRVDASGLPIEEFWNLPNTVTMLRTAVIPVLIFLPLTQGVAGSRFMAWAFIIAALTDWLDGYLARRNSGRDVTRIGKLLDPLADKLIVSTALIMLLSIGRIPLWGASMVVVIVGREIAVTGLRGMASSQGLIVAAGGPGKIKTIVQSAAIASLLFHYETIGLPAHEIGMTLLTLATALTLWSGYLYFAGYFGWNESS